MAILGDGYTQADLLKYATDVDLLVNALFAQPPYASYESYFNVYRVDVVSNESGADHPERSQLRDTALGASFNCGGLQRLICVDFGAVTGVLSRSLPANARDIVIVLVNDAEYGGSGGVFAIASTHRDAAELVLHESGHSFGLLTDEYDTSPPTCFNTVEPTEANAALNIDRDQIKWAAWVEAATALPTTGTANGVVGAYQGARYCTTGLYRPTFNSKMRSLNRPFEQVNSEQLIRRIYNFVSPIDASFPAESDVTVNLGATVEFSVTTPAPSHGLSIQWYIDMVAAGQGHVLTVDAARISAGTHRIDVEVSDRTSAVRKDSARVLVENRSWTLTVNASSEDLLRALLEMLKRWRG
jgi:hypothetical protein